MQYPNTYYASTAIAQPIRAPLQGDIEVDVCIVGAGIAGLSCALELINLGKTVAIVEREAVAWGASGRSGGLVMAGWAQGLDAIEQRVGLKKSQALFELSVRGVDKIRQNITDYALQHCDLKEGQLMAARYPQGDELRAKLHYMADNYEFSLAFLETEQVREICRTQRYFQGLYSSQSFHFHPLNYCLGLAQVLEEKGVLIYEKTAANEVKSTAGGQRVITATGTIQARQVVFCGGGYSGGETPELKRSFLPISTYMLLTEPLGPLASQLISRPISIMDDRRAGDYYRLVEGDRLLWGSRISTAKKTDEDHLATLLRQDMVAVYPELGEVKIDKCWSGLMAYAGHKMPIVTEPKKGQWICSAFGGHGLNTGTVCGTLVAQAICGINNDYRQLEPFGLAWNGGVLGPVVANLTYKYLRIRDQWQERV